MRSRLDLAAGTAIAAGLAFAFLSIAGAGAGEGDGTEGPLLCEADHRGDRATSPVSLPDVKKAYEEVARQVAGSLRAAETKMPALLDAPHDAGFPACRKTVDRIEKLGAERLRALRGRKLLFLAVSDPERVHIPREIAQDPKAEVFLLKCPKLRDVARVARNLDRPVNPASAAFARALGVRCADTWVEISETGNEVLLHELD